MLVDNAFQAKASKDLGIETGIQYSLSNIIFYLESICKELGYDFVSCFEQAYNEIKDRKGRWVNGSFVKEEDLWKNEIQGTTFTRNRTNGIATKEAGKVGTVQNEGTEPTKRGNLKDPTEETGNGKEIEGETRKPPGVTKNGVSI